MRSKRCSESSRVPSLSPSALHSLLLLFVCSEAGSHELYISLHLLVLRLGLLSAEITGMSHSLCLDIIAGQQAAG